MRDAQFSKKERNCESGFNFQHFAGQMQAGAVILRPAFGRITRTDAAIRNRGKRREKDDFFRIAIILADLATSLPSAARRSVLNLSRGGTNEAAPSFHSVSGGTGRTSGLREQRATT